jgi:pimeloyl-ACP methyl ester carboxylesterase
VKERPVVFGSEARLVGVITEPVNRAGSKTACIFVNAGLIHHVGPNRLYVRLARQLASLGYPSLRFDLLSRGDSDTRRDGLSFVSGSLADVRLAMEALQKAVGAERFVLMGICSGAVNSLHVATEEPRVAGVIAIDGPSYQTFGYHVRYYVRRIVRMGANALTGRSRVLQRLRGAGAQVKRSGPQPRAEDEFAHLYGDLVMPSRDQAAQVLSAMVDRGARMLFIYTGSWSIYNYAGQFRDAFPEVMKRGAIHVEYAPDADHTFTRLHHQEQLVEMVGGWMMGSFSGGDADTPKPPVDRPGVSAER